MNPVCILSLPRHSHFLGCGEELLLKEYGYIVIQVTMLAETVSFFFYIQPILTVVLPVISGILAFYTATQKVRKDLEAEFDKDLRTKRIETYPTLWSDLMILTHNEIIYFHDITNQELVCLYRNLHIWYLGYGMFLSISSRKQFDKLKDNIRDFLNKENLIDSLKKETLDKKLQDNLLDNECIRMIKKIQNMKKIEKRIKRIMFSFRNSTDRDAECFKKIEKIEELIRIGKNFRDSLANDIGGRREFF
jgi:hypothetical protein